MSRKKRYFLILIFLVPWGGFAGGRDESPDEDLYSKDVRFERSYTYATTLLKKYPPDQFVIIGLGRTTGLISERLRQLSQRGDYVVESPVEGIAEILHFSPEQKTIFFKKILPSPEFLKGRRLVLHRVLWRSISMSLIARHLIEFLQTQGYPMPLYAYFISDEDEKTLPLFHHPETQDLLNNAVVEVVVDHDYQKRFRNELDWDTYVRGMTRIGKFLPATPDEMIKKDFSFGNNPIYQSLVQAVELDLKHREGNHSCPSFFEFLFPIHLY